MKKFKEILEDVRLNPEVGKEISFGNIRGFTENDVRFFGKPVATKGDLDLYQIHHGDSSHRGHGMFIDINSESTPSAFRYNEGGLFIVHDRPKNKFIGYMQYDSHPRRQKDLHITTLKSTIGPHKGVRDFIYDTAADRLKYTLVSDNIQTEGGKRGWEKDIKTGKNISVRYVRNHFKDDWDEYPASEINPSHIWSRQSSILHPRPDPNLRISKNLFDPTDVFLVRRPR
jgi:hypothetical protein